MSSFNVFLWLKTPISMYNMTQLTTILKIIIFIAYEILKSGREIQTQGDKDLGCNIPLRKPFEHEVQKYFQLLISV